MVYPCKCDTNVVTCFCRERVHRVPGVPVADRGQTAHERSGGGTQGCIQGLRQGQQRVRSGHHQHRTRARTFGPFSIWSDKRVIYGNLKEDWVLLLLHALVWFFCWNSKHSFITAEELREVMKTLGDYMSNEDVEEMVKHADKNGDGRIDYEGNENINCTMQRPCIHDFDLSNFFFRTGFCEGQRFWIHGSNSKKSKVLGWASMILVEGRTKVRRSVDKKIQTAGFCQGKRGRMHAYATRFEGRKKKRILVRNAKIVAKK